MYVNGQIGCFVLCFWICMNVCLFCVGINFWLLFLFIGIYVIWIMFDYWQIDVEFWLWLWNCNYVGMYFGGSLFVMIDLFWMLGLLYIFGCDYYVWDCVGVIDFFKFGWGMVCILFCIDDVLLVELCVEVVGGGKVLCWFSNDVVDESGEVVVQVCKQVYLWLKLYVC